MPSLTRRTPLARLALRGGLAKARTPGRACGLRPAAVLLSLTYAQAPSPPRPVAGLAFVSVGKRGALSVPLFFIFKARPPRPAGAFAPDGWAGLVRKVLCRIRAGQNHPALPARPSPRPGPVVGRFPPSHATVARPTRTPSPSPNARCASGFPQGRCRHYAGAARGRGQNDGKDC